MRVGWCRAVFVTVVLNVVLPASGWAQAEVERSSDRWRPQGWGVELGVVRQGVRDELASPLRYRGLGFHGGLSLTRSGPKSAWDLELLGQLARAESRITRPDGSWEDLYLGSLAFTYLRAVGRLRDDQVQLYLGGRFGGWAQYRYHQYWPNHSERFGDVVLPLELAGRWDLALNPRTRLQHTASLPLVSLVFRTPYSSLKYAPDLTVAGPSTARGFSSRLSLSRRVGSGVALTIFHRISVFHYPDPLPVSRVGHGMGVELEFLR